MLKIQNTIHINEVLLQWFFNKKSSGGAVKTEIISNQKYAKKFHTTIIRKFKKRKIQSSFKDNIWGTDLADM